jgi:hypothetical protein
LYRTKKGSFGERAWMQLTSLTGQARRGADAASTARFGSCGNGVAGFVRARFSRVSFDRKIAVCGVASDSARMAVVADIRTFPTATCYAIHPRDRSARDCTSLIVTLPIVGGRRKESASHSSARGLSPIAAMRAKLRASCGVSCALHARRNAPRDDPRTGASSEKLHEILLSGIRRATNSRRSSPVSARPRTSADAERYGTITDGR